MNKEIIQTKLVFLGEAAVGKSSIVLRFVKDEFSASSESTIGGFYFFYRVIFLKLFIDALHNFPLK